MSDLAEALKLARETIAATAPESCDCNECKLARAILALAEQRTAEEERADVVAMLRAQCQYWSAPAVANEQAHRAALHCLIRIENEEHVGAAAKETKT